MIPVNSSRLAQIGWQPVNEGDSVGALWVQFTGNGTTGYYSGCPRDIFEQLRDSPSKGRFLQEAIIKQGYPFTASPLPS